MVSDKVLQLISFDLKSALQKRCPKHDSDLVGSIDVRPNGKGGLSISMLNRGIYTEMGTGGTESGQSSAVGGKTITIPASTNRKMPVTKSGGSWEVEPALQKWANDKGMGGNVWGLAKHIQLFGTRPQPFIRETMKFDFPRILQKYLA